MQSRCDLLLAAIICRRVNSPPSSIIHKHPATQACINIIRRIILNYFFSSPNNYLSSFVVSRRESKESRGRRELSFPYEKKIKIPFAASSFGLLFGASPVCFARCTLMSKLNDYTAQTIPEPTKVKNISVKNKPSAKK